LGCQGDCQTVSITVMLPLFPDVWQSAIERYPIAGHQVEPVDMEQLFHLAHHVRLDHDRLAVSALIRLRVEVVRVEHF
jgi:hypothetical protein